VIVSRFSVQGVIAVRTKRTSVLISVLAVWILLSATVRPARAQGSGSSRIGQPGSQQPVPYYRQPYAAPAQPVRRAPTTEEFARSMWVFLVRPQSPYTLWPPLPGKEGFREGARPHGPLVRLYADAKALADPKGLPAGSILILEDYAADQKTRTGINVMYRVKGYDPMNGDWYWMKYLENGTLVRTSASEANKPIAGRVTSCIDCHRKAADNDFVFSNDRAAMGKDMEKMEDMDMHKQKDAKPSEKNAAPKSAEPK
jgi:hypothetical protein